MDAGGSATRLTLFTMNEETKTMKIMFGKPYECESKKMIKNSSMFSQFFRNNISDRALFHRSKSHSQFLPLFLSQDKGIASYTQDRLLELKQKMMSCLDKPFTDEAIPRYKRIPLYFGATGGMRLLK